MPGKQVKMFKFEQNTGIDGAEGMSMTEEIVGLAIWQNRSFFATPLA